MNNMSHNTTVLEGFRKINYVDHQKSTDFICLCLKRLYPGTLGKIVSANVLAYLGKNFNLRFIKHVFIRRTPRLTTGRSLSVVKDHKMIQMDDVYYVRYERPKRHREQIPSLKINKYTRRFGSRNDLAYQAKPL